MGWGIRIPALGVDTKKGDYFGATGGPKVWAGGDIGAALDNASNSTEGKFYARYLTGNQLGGKGGIDMGNTLAIGGIKADQAKEQASQMSQLAKDIAAGGGSGVLDPNNAYEKLALDLTTKQKAADARDLQFTSGSNLAKTRSDLAMRGGLTAGANERLAEASQDSFADAYGNLATKYGIGAAEIRKQALDKEQDLALQRAMGADRVNAINQANQGGLLGGKIIPGWL